MQQDRNLKAKQNRAPQPNHQSQASKTKEHFNSNIEFQTDVGSKSNTKFPPLRGNKNDETSISKTNQLPISMLERKTTEPQRKSIINTNYLKKFNVKKKIEKKKPIIDDFKPQLAQKYDQYQSFLSYVNISNNIKITCQDLQNPYVLYVGKGNNGLLIKSMFKTSRPWWTIEETDPENEKINLHWYQLRQNHILDQFKEMNSFDEFDKFDYYMEEGESEEKSFFETKTQIRTSTQRSQSLISKDTSSFLGRRVDIQLKKRNSSRSKNENRSQQRFTKVSPSVKNHNMKQLKTQVLQSEVQNAQKKILSNPKMWPIYFMYRKLFSGSDMKKLKKMEIIQEDGRIHGKLLRNRIRCIQNRSNHIKMHNHLENNWNLSNKKALFVNVRQYFQALKINPFDYIPMTFHVQKIGDKQYQSFVEEYHRRCEQIAQDQKNSKKSQYKTAFRPKRRNAWLVKPGQNTNRGIGIEVVQNLEEIKQIITKNNVDAEGRPRTHIIQEYIMPFLYQKRKFDIRCYILITSVNGIQKGYWYNDGYIRTACKEFNMKNLANRMIHLTNDAVQKKCEDYGRYEPGNKLSFSDFQRYLDSNFNGIEGTPKFKFWQQAYPQMKKLATDAIKSVYTKINPTKKQFSFEIFGLDFLIDENFKVWLIEANTNPCLELSSPLLGRIIPSMLENAFRIAVDPVFPPPPLAELSKMTKKLVLPESPLETNKFQLVFDEVEQSSELKTLLTNIPAVQIYNIEQEEQEYGDQIEGQ